MNSNAKKLGKIIGVSLFFVLLSIYGIFSARELLFGIKIKNVSLVDGSTISESTILVTGNAKNAVFLSLNGREISVDKEGNFEETIALSLGYNIVTLEAKDKFGNIDQKDYQLIHQ